MPGQAGSSGIHRRVCCSLLKALLFSSSGRVKLLLLSLGIKSLEMVAGRPAVPGREGSVAWVRPAQRQGELWQREDEEMSRPPPAPSPAIWGAEGRKPTCRDGSGSGVSMHRPHSCCISMQTPSPIQDERNPPK